MTSSADPAALDAAAARLADGERALSDEAAGRLAPALEAFAASRPEYGRVPLGLVPDVVGLAQTGADLAGFTARVAGAFRAADTGGTLPGTPVTAPHVPDVGPVHPAPVPFPGLPGLPGPVAPAPGEPGGPVGPRVPRADDDPDGGPFEPINDLTGAYATPASQAAVERARADAARRAFLEAYLRRHGGGLTRSEVRRAKEALGRTGRASAAAATRAASADRIVRATPGGGVLNARVPGTRGIPFVRAVPGVSIALTGLSTAHEIKEGGDPVKVTVKNTAGLAAGTAAGAAVAGAGVFVGAPVIVPVVVGAAAAYGVGKAVSWGVGKLLG